MPRRQLLIPDIQLQLIFRTVPSTAILPFALPLPSQTHWHILRRTDGIYLQQYLKRGSQPFYQLSTVPDPAIAQHKHLSIRTRLHAFTVYLHNNNPIAYSSDGVDYAALTGARDFLGPGDYHFTCGDLEFILSFQAP